jgi:hypothetical protein
MSSQNFENLIAEHPELQASLQAITKWLADHKSRVIDPRRISASCHAIEAREIIEAITLLVRSGYFQQRFAVEVFPGKILTDTLYESPLEIPAEVRDQFDRPVLTSENRIIPVLQNARE